jgi:hypothetical protein
MLDRWAFPEIGPEHFEFERERVLWPSDIGRPTHRWIPRGMPSLRKELADCVFYLYRRNPKSGKIEKTPSGTGAIVSYYARRVPKQRYWMKLGPATEPDELVHYYGITNWHLANRGASIIRINTKDGKSRFLKYDAAQWQFIPNADDLSAIDLTDDLDLETDEIAAYPDRLFVTEKAIKNYKIGIGENTAMIGMLTNHPGQKQNHPAARFGNIALLASEDSPVRQPNKMLRPTHLIDMRSRSGFSGSPVSLWRTPTDDLLKYAKWDAWDRLGESFRGGPDEIYIGGSTLFIGLLGVHCGQFWDPVKVYKSPQPDERDGDPIHEGDQLYIQSGMTLVVPAWRISELLALEVFDMTRKKRDNRRREEFVRTTPAPEVASEAEAAPPNTDENPNAREDFMRLQSVAARKQKQDD